MPNSTITQLLADAELVALYGQRSGKLSDTKLAVAIQQAHQVQPGLEWGSAAAVDLQTALSEAIRVIEPVTLVDLHNWNPFDAAAEASEQRSNMTRVGFVTIAVILMLCCGYYTIWYKTATQLLANIASATTEQQNLIINETFFSLVGDKPNVSPEDFKNPNSIINNAIRQKIAQLQDIEKEIQKNRKDYNSVNLYLFPAIPFFYYVKSYFATEPNLALPYLGNPACDQQAIEAVLQQTAPSPATLDNAKPTPAAVAGVSSDPSGVGTIIQPRQGDDEEAQQVAGLKSSVQRNQRISNDIRCILGLQAITQFNQFKLDVGALKMTIEVVGIWVLPGLYGALGAMMYFMRWFLNQMRPNPGFGRVVLRVSLSTFAGIAVGWFWSPSLSENLAPNEITLGVLAIAFLVGFSIDVFFALLDRMVILANSAINRLGPA
jgi:hypothetical protein